MKANIGDKKAVLVQKLQDIFAGKAKSVTPEQTAAALAWQVPGLTPVMAPTPQDGEDDDLPDHLA